MIARERITFMIGPPTFFVALMDAPGFSLEQVESLRLVSSGGAGVTPAFVDEASARLGARVKRTYGSTEAPTITTSTPRDPARRAPRDRRPRDRRRRAARLRSGDGPGTRRPASPGELWLRGPELFAGYADPEQTRAPRSRSGWFRTGDLATVDADGWLTIVGRIKDVIIRGGENIAAAEVEGVLEAHPVGAPGRRRRLSRRPPRRAGVRVRRHVRRRSTSTRAEPGSSSRASPAYKTPERVVRVDELPLLAAGKPDRAALKARAAKVTPGLRENVRYPQLFQQTRRSVWVR